MHVPNTRSSPRHLCVKLCHLDYLLRAFLCKVEHLLIIAWGQNLDEGFIRIHQDFINNWDRCETDRVCAVVTTQQSQEEVSWRSRLSLSLPLVEQECSRFSCSSGPPVFCSTPVWVFSRCPGFLPHSKNMNIKLIGDFWLLLSVSDPGCIGSGCWNSTFIVSLNKKQKPREDNDGVKPKRGEQETWIRLIKQSEAK